MEIKEKKISHEDTKTNGEKWKITSAMTQRKKRKGKGKEEIYHE